MSIGRVPSSRVPGCQSITSWRSRDHTTGFLETLFPSRQISLGGFACRDGMGVGGEGILGEGGLLQDLRVFLNHKAHVIIRLVLFKVVLNINTHHFLSDNKEWPSPIMKRNILINHDLKLVNHLPLGKTLSQCNIFQMFYCHC